MFSGPMFRRESQAATSKGRPFVFRAAFAVVLGIIALLVALIVFQTNSAMDSRQKFILYGRILFLDTIVADLLVLIFLVPAQVAGAIAEEREKDTLPMLLLTRLTPFEIVVTKAFARWLPTTNPILTGLPMLVISAWLAGLEFESVLAVLVMASTSWFMASLAILASARRELVAVARAQTMGWIFGWLIGPPIMTVIPVSSGTLWGELLMELKSLCASWRLRARCLSSPTTAGSTTGQARLAWNGGLR